MSKISLPNLNFYDPSYNSEIPFEQYFLVTFGKIPSKYSDNKYYDVSIVNELMSNGFKLDVTTYLQGRRTESETKTSLYINIKKEIFIKVIEIPNKNPNLCQIECLYDVKNGGDFTKQIDIEQYKKLERTKKRSDINLIKNDMGHLDVEEYDLLAPEIDLVMNYGESFIKIHNTIVERLKKPYDKGIVLFHGDPGTGKTTYIKHLTKLIDNKEILFVPPSMAEMLSEPSIIPFLMDHKNSILIIEDAERVISDRESNGSSAGVSNILNITDGILGDCLNIQIIATFNMKREKIDQALLRKGRLITEYKFGKLSITDTNRLLKHLGKDHIVNEEMVLADIYNIDVDVYKTQTDNHIGFRR